MVISKNKDIISLSEKELGVEIYKFKRVIVVVLSLKLFFR